MAKLPPLPGTTGRRDWRTAFGALRKLLANGDRWEREIARNLALDAPYR